jgi:peptidoglycan/xylan/chitin deacetylase (PgdA/CDA1 family)
VVVPPAAFIGGGVPQPGSLFHALVDDHSFDGKGKVIALTFDDGPGPFTAQIMAVLEQHHTPATFFQIVKQSSGMPALVGVMVAAGFHVEDHSQDHPHLPSLNPAQQSAEIEGSADQLDAITGEGTRCFRPPYGEYDQTTLNLIAQRGLATALWSVDTDDWKKPGVPAIVNRTLRRAKDRSILLLHDGGGDRSQTVAALPWIINGLSQQGFTFTTIC